MGSDVGHLSMYYTEDEPPIDFIGKKRHYFSKPSVKGMNQGGMRLPMGGIASDRMGAPFSDGFHPAIPREEVILKNPESQLAVRKIQ
mmetsp:Transcript_35577/g.54383  ORF Transcript_35577/g.54383 Transcript_35577/m.54383 type:complete len:87 (+) Transcript_35577:1430-1690(+)